MTNTLIRTDDEAISAYRERFFRRSACNSCAQPPFSTENRPCPFHTDAAMDETAAWWMEYDRRKALDPNYMTEDLNGNPPLGRRYR